MSIAPDLESLFITNTEKELFVKQVQREKGDKYSGYMEGIADRFEYAVTYSKVYVDEISEYGELYSVEEYMEEWRGF